MPRGGCNPDMDAVHSGQSPTRPWGRNHAHLPRNDEHTLDLGCKKAEYSTPSLSVLGAVTDLTASGSNNQKENPGMVGPTFNMV